MTKVVALMAIAASVALAAPAASADDLPVVDVLVLYTPTVGGEEAARRVAEGGSAYTNQAFVNSEANVRTRIAAVLPAPDYNPEGKPESDAAYDYVFQPPASAVALRDQHRGDVTAVLASDVGGFSTSVPRPVRKDSPGMGSMMLLGHDRVTLEPDYYAHELGHLLGLAHDKYVGGDGTGEGYAFARGYVLPSMKVRDIMAYVDLCRDAGKDCPVIPYYSNPRLQYQGEPLGVPKGSPDPADAVSMLDESAPIVSAYR